MQRIFLSILAGLLIAGCETPEGGVTNKVLVDFGVREAPEGYERGSDTVYARLSEVGATEIKRMNGENRHGAISFEQEGLRGAFYKELKVYEDFFPLEATATNTGTNRERGYNGYIDYSYTVYQSPRFPTRAEAETASPTIPTGESGRETYRYRFNQGGYWNGGKGERVNR